MDMQDKFKVAIESTNDYADVNFHQELIDVDVLNKDGTYGKIKDFYRIVGLNEEGKVAAYDNRIFDNEVEAKTAVRRDSSLKLISYDDMIREAERIYLDRTYPPSKEVKPWAPEILGKNKNPKDFSMDR